MLTIISASNRKGNLTSFYSIYCKQFLEKKKIPFAFFSLQDIPDKVSLKTVYEYDTSYFKRMALKYLEPAEKLLFIIPEYNGSIPGILKLWIDGVHPSNFIGKKAALIGVSSGRAGNLRGMDHFTDILHHLQVNVMPQKLPISGMDSFLDQDRLVDSRTSELINEQLNRFIRY